jgi:hypothetical protein
MDRANCFPLFFAIAEADSYKVFQNNIYQAFETLGFPANILWPVDGVSLGKLSKIAPKSGKRHTFIRKWNGRHYRSCEWEYSDKQLELMIDGEILQIPVINLTCEDKALPFNNAPMKPSVGGGAVKHKPVAPAPRFPVSSAMPT